MASDVDDLLDPCPLCGANDPRHICGPLLKAAANPVSMTRDVDAGAVERCPHGRDAIAIGTLSGGFTIFADNARCCGVGAGDEATARRAWSALCGSPQPPGSCGDPDCDEAHSPQAVKVPSVLDGYPTVSGWYWMRNAPYCSWHVGYFNVEKDPHGWQQFCGPLDAPEGTVAAMETCAACHGFGYDFGGSDNDKACPNCHGQRRLFVPAPTAAPQAPEGT